MASTLSSSDIGYVYVCLLHELAIQSHINTKTSQRTLNWNFQFTRDAIQLKFPRKIIAFSASYTTRVSEKEMIDIFLISK